MLSNAQGTGKRALCISNLVALRFYCVAATVSEVTVLLCKVTHSEVQFCVRLSQQIRSHSAAVLSGGILSAGWTWQTHSAHRPSQLKWCGRVQTWVLNQHRATLPLVRCLFWEIKIYVKVILQFRPVFCSLLSHLQQGHYTLWIFPDFRFHESRLLWLYEITYFALFF